MKLLDLYKELCNDKTFFERYYSTSGSNYGKIFFFISTNYRGILIKSGNRLQGFANGFRVIENVEGKKRSDWSRRVGTQQEIEKQHVVNMRKSELFRVVDDAYEKTSRGIVFKKLIESDKLTHEEKNFLCYLLILTGYFNDIPNYIIERTKYVYEQWEKAGYSSTECFNIQKVFVKFAISAEHTYDIFDYDYVYLDSFFQELDGLNFLSVYHNATDVEKQALHEYIISNYKNKRFADKNNDCVISYKFKPGGNYVKNTVIDNAWILYVTKKIIDKADTDFDSFIATAISAYKEIFDVDESQLRSFIYDTDKNRSVLQVIFGKAANVPIPALVVAKDLTQQEIEEFCTSDATELEGATKLDAVSTSLKKLAKIQSNYKCALDECEICKYFTAKENGKNYLEIHHFIPREFANDFDYPIEVLENYVALCPNCHRKIHLAVDSERKHMINIIFNLRQELLAKKGLVITLQDLYNYYKIDE